MAGLGSRGHASTLYRACLDGFRSREKRLSRGETLKSIEKLQKLNEEMQREMVRLFSDIDVGVAASRWHVSTPLRIETGSALLRSMKQAELFEELHRLITEKIPRTRKTEEQCREHAIRSIAYRMVFKEGVTVNTYKDGDFPRVCETVLGVDREVIKNDVAKLLRDPGEKDFLRNIVECVDKDRSVAVDGDDAA